MFCPPGAHLRHDHDRSRISWGESAHVEIDDHGRIANAHDTAAAPRHLLAAVERAKAVVEHCG